MFKILKIWRAKIILVRNIIILRENLWKIILLIVLIKKALKKEIILTNRNRMKEFLNLFQRVFKKNK